MTKINLIPESLDVEKVLKDSYQAGYDSALLGTTAITDDPTLTDKQKLDAIAEKYPEVGAIINNPKLSHAQKVKRMRAELNLTQRGLAENRADIAQRKFKLQTQADGLHEAFKVLCLPFRCQPPQSSRLHELYEKEFMLTLTGQDQDSINIGEFFKRLDATTPQVLLVQHDWGQAFEGAHDYEGAEFRLPYPWTAFEFQTHGHRFIVIAEEVEGQPRGMIFYKHTDYWINISGVLELDKPITRDGADSVYEKATQGLNAMLMQIKAVCVALDAEVVETEVVRAPLALNKARAKRGRQPLRDFHVVNLSKRYRTAGARTGDGEGEGTKKRLHFRRGHWRHYTTHRTWIKWMLVGNPDLGFIDKEYRA